MIMRLILLALFVTSMTVANAAEVDSSARASRPDTLPAGIFPNTWAIVYGTGRSISEAGLLGFAHDTLLLTSAAPGSVLLSNIELMRRRNGGHFWRGAAWGAGIMAPVGVLGLAIAGTEPPRRQNGQRLIALGVWAGGALLGGIVGSFFPRTEEIDLAVLPVDERRATLELIAAQDSTARAEAIADVSERALRRAAKAASKKGSATTAR
jgi:hypothetical protein